MPQKAVLLLGFVPDPRNINHINAEKSVFDLHVIYWNRGLSRFEAIKSDGFIAHEIAINAVNNPLKRLLPYLKFSMRAMKQLIDICPDVIHVQGLDMLKIASKYKKKHNGNVVIVYEVADLHRLIIDEQKGFVKKVIRHYLRMLDCRLASMYELLIVASEDFYNVYFRTFVPQNKVLYMPNAPDLVAFSHYQAKNHNVNFTVGYVGAIRYKNQLKNLILAAEETDINIMIAGYEEGDAEIENICANRPNIRWVGRFDFNQQAAQLYGQCDVMYSVYDADMANVRSAIPNKLYEAVWCEIPLIVAQGTYLARMTENWGTGVAVNHKSIEELRKVILELKQNSSRYNTIVENCKKRKKDCRLEDYNKQFITRLLAITEEDK